MNHPFATDRRPLQLYFSRSLVLAVATIISLAAPRPAMSQVSSIQLLPDQADVQGVYGGGAAVEATDGSFVAAYVEYGVFTEFPSGTPAVLVVTRSTDGGATWSERDTVDTGIEEDGVQGIGVPMLFTLDSGEIVLMSWKLLGFGGAGVERTRWISADAGATWVKQASQPLGGVFPTGVTPNGTFVGLEYVETSFNREIYASTSADSGATWTRGGFLVEEDFNICTPTLNVMSDTELVFFSTVCAFGYGSSSSTYKRVSTDMGATWSAPAEVMTSASGLGTYAQIIRDADGTTLWLVYLNGVNVSYRTSTDGGTTWSDPTNWTFGDQTTRDQFPLCTTGTTGPVCMFGRILGSTYHQVYFGVIGVSGDPVGVEYLGDLVEGFTLHQNYPNPFDRETVIRFETPAPGNATLTVYNAIGQEVARLVDGPLGAGVHEAGWDASTHPAGVYFYRLQTEAGIATASMTVIR